MQFAFTRRLYIIFYFHSYGDDSFSEWDFSRLVLFHQQALSLFFFFGGVLFQGTMDVLSSISLFSILLSTDARKGKNRIVT